ncbi:MAG: hypothetical protein JXK16_08790 [Thiotrichales bacterium]|nr:hypothetical protein [Thiotrichales bacterium]
MKSLFIAQTPLQLLNCIEASKKNNQKGYFVLFYDCDENHKRMMALVEIFNVDNVQYYSLNSIFRFIFPIVLFSKFKKLKRKNEINKVYFGTYASWASFLINYLSVENTVLVDDGSKTIVIMNNPKRMGLYKKKWFKCLRKDYVQSSTFFTIYFELAQKKGLPFEKNNLSHVTTYINNQTVHNLFKTDLNLGEKQLFIGSFISDKCEKFEEHIGILANKARCDGKELYYIMHRYDDESKISELADSFNFQCVKYDFPLELVFSTIWNGQDEVWSQGSTAVDTLQLIYQGLNVRIFKMPLESINSVFQRENFSKLYDYYSEKECVILDDTLL